MPEQHCAKRPFISLSSDFGIGSEGVGIMAGTVLGLCPSATVINLTHGIESFNVVDGARELETVFYLPIGIHVCVVDPGVGSSRRPLIIDTVRGDTLIGPDNGVLLPAARRLGGVKRVLQIENSEYIDYVASRTFHGRDVFAKAAGWLAQGTSADSLGTPILFENLTPAAFDEAIITETGLQATVLHINKFGSLILNVKESFLNSIPIEEGTALVVVLPNERLVTLMRARSFAEVEPGQPILVPDDYGRVELAINRGSFAQSFGIGTRSSVRIQVNGR